VNSIDSMKLSIVIPCYKFKAYIVESVDSVASQVVDFPLEILVRDDCSGDGTYQMLADKYGNHPLVKILDATENLGPIGNLIELLSHASGEYVAILDGDDFLTDNGYYQRAVDFLDSDKEFSMFCTSYQCVEGGRIYPESAWMHGTKKIVALEDLLEKNYVSAARVFRRTPVQKEIFDGVPYPDWLFNFEILKNGKSMCETNRCSFVYRVHSGGMFSGTSQQAKEENTIKTAEIVQKNYDLYHKKNQKNTMKITQAKEDKRNTQMTTLLDTRNCLDKQDLASLVNELFPNGKGVEIGVLEGEYSKIILERWENGQLFMVDAWRHLDGYIDMHGRDDKYHHDCLVRACQNTKRWENRAHIVRMDSVASSSVFPDEYFDFIYIDADHSYEGVMRDMKAWWPKVKKGGLFCGDDYIPQDGDIWLTQQGKEPVHAGRFGVRKAVNEFMENNSLKAYGTANEPYWKQWYTFKPF